jgi:hypothetical protein
MEHTELEEELHEKAHIDYDRVAIVSHGDPIGQLKCAELTAGHQIPNPSVAALYEDALVRHHGSTYTAGSIQLTSASGVRDRHSHHGKRRSDGILGQEDRAIAARQAHRQGGDIREGHLVCSTAELRHARAARIRAFLPWNDVLTFPIRWGPVNKPMTPEVRTISIIHFPKRCSVRPARHPS